MGNQMFQYAIGKALAARFNTTMKVDLRSLLDRTPRPGVVFRDYDLDIFNLTTEQATQQELDRFLHQPANKLGRVFKNRVLNKIDPHVYYHEPHFHFTPAVFELPKNAYLEGYWQSPKYFENIDEQIRKDLTFKAPLLPKSQELSQLIKKENSVCINVRRADFVTNSFHGVCDMKYFTPSIDIIASKIANPHFFIFSDDPQWCLENFKLEYPVTFVSHEYKGPKFGDYLELMSQCKHFIIPNSSFAWWAVYLNRNSEKIVIAPKIWLTDPTWDPKDLIPADWIRVAN